MRYVEEHTYLRFSIMSVFASEMRHAAKKRNIFLGDWYNVVVAPDTVDQKTTGYVLGSCLKAEQAASHIVNLPTHPRLPLTDASRIGYFVKNFIQAFTLRK
jgi:dTDP-4-amino-4,6-dideoxygalactose transaminase